MVKLKEVSIAIFYIMHLSNDLTQCLSYVSSDKESGMKTGVNQLSTLVNPRTHRRV